MDSNSPPNYSLSLLAQRLGRSQPTNTTIQPTAKRDRHSSRYGHHSPKYTGILSCIGQERSIHHNTKHSATRVGSTSSTIPERTSKSERSAKELSSSGSHSLTSRIGAKPPPPLEKHSPYELPSTTDLTYKPQSSIV